VEDNTILFFCLSVFFEDETMNKEKQIILSTISFEISPGNFLTQEDPSSSVWMHFLTQGCVVSIQSSKRDKYILFGCNKEGNYCDQHIISIERQEERLALV